MPMECDLTRQLESTVARLASVADDLAEAARKRDDDILISGNEAARHIGCNPATISRYLKEGRLSKVTIGGSTGIRLSQINDFKAL